MGSHGIPQLLLKKEDPGKEQNKIDEYRSLVNNVHQRFANNDLATETLLMVKKVLTKNPEFYTFWNYRRKLLEAALRNDSNVDGRIKDELHFLVPLLMQFPKCYWIWNYRVWVLERVEQYTSAEVALGFWKEELELVTKMLTRDERNFHGWDYRRSVVAQIEHFQGQGTMIQSEFDYTTRMIRKTLHNFSALHYRSILIPRLLILTNATTSQRREMLEKELDMMQDALVDPFNQSAWFYHACLMSSLKPSTPDSEWILLEVTSEDRQRYYQQEISRIKEMLEDFDDCKWIFLSLIQYNLDYLSFKDEHQLSSKAELRSWLDQLSKLDPARTGRWLDLKNAIDPDVIS